MAGSYNSDRDPAYASRPFPKTCFIHLWGWEIVETAGGLFRLLAPEGQRPGYVAPFKSKQAAIDYMNQEFL